GEGTSASYGVVSVDSEHIALTTLASGESQTFRVIRVDTPVNPGNSGGGLYNESGELLGIVNAKLIDYTVENIGYAIPSNVAVYVTDNIIDHCYNGDYDNVQRGMLGVTVQTKESYMKTEKETGHVYIVEKVQVIDVLETSLVKGKVLPGDVLKYISFGDKRIDITRQFHVVDAMLNAREGDDITIGVVRDGKDVTVMVKMTKEHIIPY
ncbi:MAG: hypothetical protein IJD26_05670, partial [Lachnospiraceae bacterium]|nr:hypothetical protein [Lachnospiraceae bacterium]